MLCIHINCLIHGPLLLLAEEAWEILSCVVTSCNVRYTQKVDTQGVAPNKESQGPSLQCLSKNWRPGRLQGNVQLINTKLQLQ